MNVYLMLPRRWRFAFALRVALLLAPLIRRTPLYARRPSRLDGYREEALRLALRPMMRTRVPFDPRIEVRGALPGGAALIVSGHFLLNGQMTRIVHDAGRRLVAVLGTEREERLCYAGTSREIETLIAGPSLFVQLRRRFADGDVVLVDIDSGREHDDWPSIETAAGRRWISPAALTFAAKHDVPVVFCSTRIERRRLVVTFVRPSSNDAMFAEFCDFLRDEIAKMAR